MNPIYSDGIYANAEKTAIVLKGVYGFDQHGGEISGPVIATKDDPDTGDLFKQAISKAKPFGPIAEFVAPVVTLPTLSAPAWKVRAVLRASGMWEKVTEFMKELLASGTLEGAAAYEGLNGAGTISTDSALAAAFLPKFGMSTEDFRGVIEKANTIAG